MLVIKLFLIFSILLLSACSKSNDRASSDYLKRLKSVLDVELDDSHLYFELEFPQPRDLRQDSPNNTLSIREFLSLRQCELHTVIAHRNSLIGKVALPSQLLFNDLQILQNIP